MGQILISKLLINVVSTLSKNWHFSNAKYSIKYYSKVPLEAILELGMCLKNHILKKMQFVKMKVLEPFL